jgi:hypothetical protein
MPERLVLRSVLAVALTLPLAASGAQAGPPTFASRTCATPETSPVERAFVRERVEAWRQSMAVRPERPGGTIRVAVHVLHDGATGNVSDDAIRAQIRELDRGFAGTGYRFELASVDRTDRKAWFRMLPGTGNERHAKEALAVDPARTLNLYTCAPGQGYLGWAYYPWSLPEDHDLHGVVVHYGSLPGGPLAFYDLGRTAVHEVGHYLGLFHTFENGCAAPGDEVADTPFEASPAFGCPLGRNTCPDPGEDPVHNYMDYSDDACLTEFTAGQGARMDEIVPVFRPSLFGRDVAAALGRGAEAAGVLPGRFDFRGAAPNPVADETVMRFAIPASGPVSLRVFDLAGKQVRVLVDGVLPPGDHSALFRAEDLAPGMYFAQLRYRDESQSRTVLVLR